MCLCGKNQPECAKFIMPFGIITAHMKKLLLSLSLLLLLAATACLKKSTNDDPQPDTIGYFTQHLKASMSYAALVDTFGTPDGDIGSGIHIYVYNLTDGSVVWIGHNGTDLLYARHMSSTGQLLHTII
jgi:hypothetical protein